MKVIKTAFRPPIRNSIHVCGEFQPDSKPQGSGVIVWSAEHCGGAICYSTVRRRAREECTAAAARHHIVHRSAKGADSVCEP